jgi:hypothetical protein
MNDSNSMSLSSSQMLGQQQQLNVTFAGIPINQTQPQSPVIKVLYPFNQTIQLDGNATLQALPFNETMPNDIILQLAGSNVTTIGNSLILQFIPTNQTAYKMALLSHVQPNEN